jgi:hypothetical protein
MRLTVVQKCALHECSKPLVNYKNGRFCEDHLALREICGIIPCGRAVFEPGALTRDAQFHIDWCKQYEDRFHRLLFSGVQRVIRCQNQGGATNGAHALRGPTLQV